MAEIGATWADLGIRLVDFAEADPIWFLLTVPGGIAATVILILALWRVFFTGPIGKHMSEFQQAIAKITRRGNDDRSSS